MPMFRCTMSFGSACYVMAPDMAAAALKVVQFRRKERKERLECRLKSQSRLDELPAALAALAADDSDNWPIKTKKVANDADVIL